MYIYIYMYIYTCIYIYICICGPPGPSAGQQPEGHLQGQNY